MHLAPHWHKKIFLEGRLIVFYFKLAEATKARKYGVAQVCDCVLHQLHLLQVMLHICACFVLFSVPPQVCLFYLLMPKNAVYSGTPFFVKSLKVCCGIHLL